MKINISITLDDDLYLNEEIRELRRTKKLSKRVNDLLRASLNLEKPVISDSEAVLEHQLLELNVAKEKLLNTLDELKKAKEKEAGEWTQIM